jgi:hypothetical protein
MTFVACKLEVGELKLESPFSPFGLGTLRCTFKSEIRAIGEGKIDVSANKKVSASGGMIS